MIYSTHKVQNTLDRIVQINFKEDIHYFKESEYYEKNDDGLFCPAEFFSS